MPSLYETLQAPSNAPREMLLKNYKALSYKYKCESKDEGLIQINNAIKILTDPYQRSFYDLFGEYALSMLSNPIDSYVFPRIATASNLFMCFMYSVCVILNTTGWFFMHAMFRSYLLRNILYIISPAFLIVAGLNLMLTFRKHRSYLRRFYYAGVQLFSGSLEVLLISLALDGIVPFWIGAISALWLEAIQLVYYVAVERRTLHVCSRELWFRLVKAAAVLLYFRPAFRYRIYLPLLPVVAFGVLIFFTWFILDSIVLLFLFALDLHCRSTGANYFALGILFLYNIVALGFLYHIIRIYRTIPGPHSFLVVPKALLPGPR